MKSKRLLGVILLLYCVPYVFFAMYGDAEANTMLLYGLMTAAMGTLCLKCMKAKNFPALIIGNLLSCMISCICARSVPMERWGWYFKPFSAPYLAGIISGIALIVQLTVWKIANRIEKSREAA